MSSDQCAYKRTDYRLLRGVQSVALYRRYGSPFCRYGMEFQKNCPKIYLSIRTESITRTDVLVSMFMCRGQDMLCFLHQQPEIIS